MNRVFMRGLVWNTPKFAMSNGNENMRMVLAVRGKPNVPAQVSRIYEQPHYASTVIVRLTKERALDGWNKLGNGIYVHGLIGRLTGNILTAYVHGISLDLTDYDKGIEEYEPKNEVIISGFFEKEIALDDVKGVPCCLFRMNAVEDDSARFDEEKTSHNRAMPCKIKCYGEEAIRAHETLKKGMKVYCKGVYNTWRSRGQRRYDWAVIADELRY